MFKFHRPLVQAITATLQRIFVDGIYADKAVELELKQNPRWGSRDRKFVAETIYEMVRWWRYLLQSLSPAPQEGDNNENRTLHETHYYQLFAVMQILKGIELPDWQEFACLDKTRILNNAEQATLIRKYRESIPDWLDELGLNELGERVWEKELHELNKKAQVVLRVNTLKTTSKELIKKLLEQSIEVETICSTSPIWDEIKKNALLVVKRQNLRHLDEYKNGLFEIQDAASQLVAHFMRLEQGMTVIDACAGAGGKSLHIAALMKNRGKIISLDVEERKLTELKKRTNRAEVSIIQTQLINVHTISKLKNTADRLLMDVPCSGLGVIRRNPDAKWKLSLAFIHKIKKTQQEILSNYSQMLKPGGIMVYSTCSIFPGENQNQIRHFLESQAGQFELLQDRAILPSEGFDGFYLAAVKKL